MINFIIEKIIPIDASLCKRRRNERISLRRSFKSKLEQCLSLMTVEEILFDGDGEIAKLKSSIDYAVSKKRDKLSYMVTEKQEDYLKDKGYHMDVLFEAGNCKQVNITL